MTMTDETVPKMSRAGFALLCLGLLVAIFTLVRDDAHHRHDAAKAKQATESIDRQRLTQQQQFLVAQARALADFDALVAQLRAHGFVPVVSPEQAAIDFMSRPAPVVTSAPPSASPTPTTTPAAPSPSPSPTAPPESPPPTSPPTTQPPPSPPPNPPPSPSPTCVNVPALGPLPMVSLCAAQQARRFRA